MVERDSHVIHHIDDNCIAHASVQLDYVVNSSKHKININFFRPIVMISTVSYMYNGVCTCTSTCKGVDSITLEGRVLCAEGVCTQHAAYRPHYTFISFKPILVSSSTPFSMPHAINSHQIAITRRARNSRCALNKVTTWGGGGGGGGRTKMLAKVYQMHTHKLHTSQTKRTLQKLVPSVRR